MKEETIDTHSKALKINLDPRWYGTFAEVGAVYVYPLQRHEGDELQTIHTLKVKPELQPLYDYLVGRGSFVQLDNFNPKYLAIFSRDVLKRIASGDESWDEMVPPQVAEIIRQRGFFGYKKKEYSDFDRSLRAHVKL